MVAGTIRVRLGGYAKELPELNIDDNEAWQAKLATDLASQLKHVDTIREWDQAVAVASASTPLMVDLLVAYDHTGVLGGREWIRQHATPAEVYAAFKEVALASYPFGRDLSKFPSLIGMMMEQVAKVSSASTSSPPKSTGGRRGTSAAA